MRECGAAVLIFTADEQFFDVDRNEVWRPSENVAHELGAASVLYDNRIIIFKEEGVTLASNYSSIGYIEFEKNKLGDKGVDLFRELVKFKIVNISVSG
jgi:predicted nucleotide-binding protein